MNSLQRKLRVVFTAIGVLGLAVIALTGYTVTQWRETEDSAAHHYTRSLRLQEVRALSFEAYKEVPDAVIGRDLDAREEYEERLAPIDEAFAEWAALAEDDAEREQVRRAETAAERLQSSAERVFSLVDAGRTGRAAIELERVEETAFEPFDALTTAAVGSDRAKRREVEADAVAARRNTTMALAIAGFGVVSLLLLFGAHLAGVFAPLAGLRTATRRLAEGDRGVRLPEGDDNEIGQIQRNLNLIAERWVDAEDSSTALDRSLADRLHHSEIEPMLLLHEVFDRVDDEVIRRSISTRITVAEDVPTLTADRARLREALSELVRNALQALEALPGGRGELALHARRDEGSGWAALDVVDNGPGITADDVSWLYDGAAPPDQRGAGLRIATEIVEQHGGRLLLEALPDGGTRASILLHPTHDERKNR